MIRYLNQGCDCQYPALPVNEIYTDMLALHNPVCQAISAGADIPLGETTAAVGMGIAHTAQTMLQFVRGGTYLITVTGVACNPDNTDVALAASLDGTATGDQLTFTKAAGTTVPFTLQFTVTAAAWQTLTLTNPTAAAVSYGDLRTTVQRVV